MKKDVTLTLKGLHLTENEENNLESKHAGNYFCKDGVHFVMAKVIEDGITTDLRLTFDEKS
ncbi:MAG: hypothetical protein IKY04_05135, partial [Lachnospiraceae bacterium]|nr:hypothetical protein [Lachnospiraceae bacterium]